MATLNINKELNGIEILFDTKPAQETLETLKANGFRWHRVKKLWYAKNTPERMALVSGLVGIVSTRKTEKKEIDLSDLGKNAPSLWGSELTKAIREDLKRRGVSGVSVRLAKNSRDFVYITIKATPEEMASIEEAKERYSFGQFKCDIDRGLYINGHWVNYNDFCTKPEDEQEKMYIDYLSTQIKSINQINHYHLKRHNYWEFTTELYNKVVAVEKIVNQWNYDNSDYMTDYFDVGYYTHFEIETGDFLPRELMTEEERQSLKEEREEEDRQREEAIRKYEEEERKAKEAQEKYIAWEKEAIECINNNISVEDLEKPLYITNLLAGIGKENTLKELKERIEEEERKHEAEITRRINFNTKEALDYFNELFLGCFDFLAGFGGCGSVDERLEGIEIYQLNEEQRNTVKFFDCKCIGAYFNNELQFVINPEGHNYARNVYLPSEETAFLDAEEEEKRQEEESREKDPFYIPAPLDEQIKNISVGEEITVYKCDGWMLCNIESGRGKVQKVYEGTWAQYKGYYIEMTLNNKINSVFLKDRGEVLIYKGIREKLPQSVTNRQITENMSELLNYNELFPATYNYYKTLGIMPLVNTVPR